MPVMTTHRNFPGATRARRALLAIALVSAGTGWAAEPLVIGALEHYTENRGWNEAGLGPLYQAIISAVVVPSGHPTQVRAKLGGVHRPLSHFPQPPMPHLYVVWDRVEPGLTGPWRVIAERDGTPPAEASTPAIATPQMLPLLREVRVTGDPLAPHLNWDLPDLSGFDVDRIRVAVRGGARVLGRFLPVMYLSPPLPPEATSFDVPAGVLVPGQRHVFQVALEDLEDGRLENRSLSFSEPHTPPLQ